MRTEPSAILGAEILDRDLEEHRLSERIRQIQRHRRWKIDRRFLVRIRDSRGPGHLLLPDHDPELESGLDGPIESRKASIAGGLQDPGQDPVEPESEAGAVQGPLDSKLPKNAAMGPFEYQDRPRGIHSPGMRTLWNPTQIDRNRAGAKIRFHVHSCQTGSDETGV
jgi:hypothetical protein